MSSSILVTHAKNAALYDSEKDYLAAFERKVGRRATKQEKINLIHTASTVWKSPQRVVGRFDVCDSCHSSLASGNDIVRVVKGRVEIGKCDLCGVVGRPLRRVDVDNFEAKAVFTVKRASVFNRGQVVRIIDVPARFNALKGEVVEIVDVEMNQSKGVVYTVVLANVKKVPYEFRHHQLEEVTESNEPVGYAPDIDSVADEVLNEELLMEN
jgi:hypothetical protein